MCRKLFQMLEIPFLVKKKKCIFKYSYQLRSFSLSLFFFFFIKKEKKRKEKKKLTKIFVGLKILYVVSSPSPKSRPPLCLYSLVCHVTYLLHQHPQHAVSGHVTIVPLQIQRSFQSFSHSITVTYVFVFHLIIICVEP